MMLAVLIPICMLMFPKTSIHVLEKFIHYNTQCNEFTLKVFVGMNESLPKGSIWAQIRNKK